jgi:hypothetical protein
MSHINDFNARDRNSLIAAYAEGSAQGRERFEDMWAAADIYRAKGVPLPLAATFAALEIYTAQPVQG